jgi:hypothetical protein
MNTVSTLDSDIIIIAVCNHNLAFFIFKGIMGMDPSNTKTWDALHFLPTNVEVLLASSGIRILIIPVSTFLNAINDPSSGTI